jgi:hypothetical protein
MKASELGSEELQRKRSRVKGEGKMQQVQEKQTGSCPNCGADGSKRTWREVTGGNGYVRVRSDAHKFNGSEVLVLVCKVCGYVQFFTDPQDFN